MSLIKYAIEKRNSEKVRDRIAAVLASEFNSQVVNYYNVDADRVDFYLERSTPIDDSELSVINISIDGIEYDNKNYGNVDARVIYNIDVYCNSKNKGSNAGDKLAAFKSQRLLGICWGILEYPSYKTLDFEPGFIGSTMVKGSKQLVIKSAGNDDALNTIVNRLQFEVKLVEGTPLPAGIPFEQNNTTVTLGETDKGYQIIFVTP